MNIDFLVMAIVTVITAVLGLMAVLQSFWVKNSIPVELVIQLFSTLAPIVESTPTKADDELLEAARRLLQAHLNAEKNAGSMTAEASEALNKINAEG